MATEPSNKQILLKKTLTFWAQSGPDPVVFDVSQSVYGGPLDFEPDAFFVRNVSYISNNEQNINSLPCITCNFGVPGEITYIGVFSAQGSINNKGTYHEFNYPNPLLPNELEFLVVLLNGKDTIDVNNSIDRSSWFCQLEFVKYVDDPIF